MRICQREYRSRKSRKSRQYWIYLVEISQLATWKNFWKTLSSRRQCQCSLRSIQLQFHIEIWSESFPVLFPLLSASATLEFLSMILLDRILPTRVTRRRSLSGTYSDPLYTVYIPGGTRVSKPSCTHGPLSRVYTRVGRGSRMDGPRGLRG